MKATGRDGRRGAWRSGTGSTTTSGTVSSGYTSTSSRLSWMSVEAATHFQQMEMKDLEFVPSLEEAAKIRR